MNNNDKRFYEEQMAAKIKSLNKQYIKDVMSILKDYHVDDEDDVILSNIINMMDDVKKYIMGTF